MSSKIREALTKLLSSPMLDNARYLESILREEGIQQEILGRANQKSSIEAASESDRGFTERLANAFDASLTAARIAAGIKKSTRDLTPRNCAERFLCANTQVAEWRPVVDEINFKMPQIQAWLEDPKSRNRFRKHNPGDGLATVLVSDYATGIDRTDMPSTILALNSESKLKAFEAIGQFGHGGSSALSFCESCLIVTQPRFSADRSSFFWTLVVCEEEEEESKQQLVRKWFCADDQLPLIGSLSDYPALADTLPGTSLWHFGYNRGGWISIIRGPSQSNPWGRLGRLFFSYPLPFQLTGEIARGDTTTGTRTIQGSYFRLLERNKKDGEIEYYSDEISQSLILDNTEYGLFKVFVFVLKDRSTVASYLDPQHPVILTLNGQNHGELTRNILTEANLPELASCCIVELRLDELNDEALNEIISNSREMPKSTVFTRALKTALVKLLSSDEMLRKLEEQRQMDKARKTSSDLSAKISKFLSSILSDAVSEPTPKAGGNAPGTEKDRDGDRSRIARPEIPASDTPSILEFLAEKLIVPEGTTAVAKFRSDARPPRFCFHGDDRRCFANIELVANASRELRITGKHEISPNGYGFVTIYCPEDTLAPIENDMEVGKLILTIQSTDGRTLRNELPLIASAKPAARERKRRSDVQTNIVFVAPDGENFEELKTLLVEQDILKFSDASFLHRYAEVLNVEPSCTSYWGEKNESANGSVLEVEINAANPDFLKLLTTCSSAEERALSKERYVRDVVLDCYQHCFRLEELPEQIAELVLSDADEKARAVEIHLNHQKAVRIVSTDRQLSKLATKVSSP